MFAVWQPMLSTDWSPPSNAVLGRLADPRVLQYWDQSHVLAKRMEEDARPPQPVQDCCVRAGILWDLAAVYPPGAAWSERMPPAVVFNGPVADVVGEVEAALVPSAKVGLADSAGETNWPLPVDSRGGAPATAHGRLAPPAGRGRLRRVGRQRDGQLLPRRVLRRVVRVRPPLAR